MTKLTNNPDFTDDELYEIEKCFDVMSQNYFKALNEAAHNLIIREAKDDYEKDPVHKVLLNKFLELEHASEVNKSVRNKCAKCRKGEDVGPEC